jgi:hypothetical protein
VGYQHGIGTLPICQHLPIHVEFEHRPTADGLGRNVFDARSRLNIERDRYAGRVELCDPGSGVVAFGAAALYQARHDRIREDVAQAHGDQVRGVDAA